MRRSPRSVDDPSLEGRLGALDAQIRDFEAALKAQQHRQGHVRSLELELAALVKQGAAVVGELEDLRNRVRETADAAVREELTIPAARLQEFEQRAVRILDAYGTAVRAAQQAVARAEARIDAFDERVGRELAQAAREIRDAAALLRAAERPPDTPIRGSRARRLVPALLAAMLFLAGLLVYNWVARTLRDASARADAAEREAHATRREANQQIATLERSGQQASREALSIAARAERTTDVLAAPDVRRTVMLGQRTAADAVGQAIWSPSRGVVVTGTRLPALSAAEVYQVWLVMPRRVAALGLVTPDAEGRVSGVFDLPPEAAGSVRGFMVTREPAGGSPRPAGRVVLAS